MDIVEFVEQVVEFQLTDFQKEFVRKIYEAKKNGKTILYVPPRGCQNFNFELLQAVVIMAMEIMEVAQERGLLKSE